MQEHKNGAATPKKNAMVSGKMITIIFWDTDGILMINVKVKNIARTG